MPKLIGMGGSITVGAAAYPVSEWSANFTSDVQDVTDTGSAGWTARLAGVKSVEITFTAFWGSSAASLATTFEVGDTVTANLAIGTGGGGVAGNFIVSSFTIKTAAKNAVTFECTAQSNGEVVVS